MGGAGVSGSDRRDEAALIAVLQTPRLGNVERSRALRDLKGVATEVCVQTLRDCISAPDADLLVRHQAMSILSKVGGDDAIDGICEAMERGEQDLTGPAARALADAGTDHASVAIINYAREHSRELPQPDRTMLIHVLSRLGDSRVAPIMALHLRDRSRKTRWLAAAYLLRRRTVGAQALVQAAAEDLSWFRAIPLRRELRRARWREE